MLAKYWINEKKKYLIDCCRQTALESPNWLKTVDWILLATRMRILSIALFYSFRELSLGHMTGLQFSTPTTLFVFLIWYSQLTENHSSHAIVIYVRFIFTITRSFTLSLPFALCALVIVACVNVCVHSKKWLCWSSYYGSIFASMCEREVKLHPQQIINARRPCMCIDSRCAIGMCATASKPGLSPFDTTNG